MLNLRRIDEIIYRFENGSELDLGSLMDDARVLAAQMHYLSKLVGEVGKKYRECRYIRKSTFAKLREEYKSSGVSVSAAESKAESSDRYDKAFKLESDYEGSYSAGKMRISAIEKVLDRMNQEIAELREEKKQVRHT